MVRRITKEIWLIRFVKTHGDLYDYNKSIFDDCFTRIEIYCKLCKMYFKQSTISHSRGSGCKVCATKRTRKAQMHTDEMVEAVFHQVHNHKYIYTTIHIEEIAIKIIQLHAQITEILKCNQPIINKDMVVKNVGI